MHNLSAILIIDDDDDDKQMFCEVISEIDERILCTWAGNGQEGLQLLQEQDPLPNFIFLDLNMPRMNGRQCLVQIKKLERLAAIPVIIYSTSKLEEDKEETMRLGADYFLTKPSSMQLLKKELLSVFEKKYDKRLPAASS
jgi:CheY-like chemotaxis protein